LDVWKSITWKKASEIPSLGQDAKLFPNKISTTDVKQGYLGDCYFLSVLSLLALRENRIKRLFVSQENRNYQIRILKDGNEITIEVDDFFPCRGEQLAFAQSANNSIWVQLLEKAWAKKFGCYFAVEGGTMKDAMFDLTSAPTITMETSDPKVWEELQEALKNGYIAGAASKSNKNKPEAEVIYEEESKGDNSKVTDDHAFAILDIFDTRDSKGRDVRLLKIRNPWGKFDQKGDPDIKWEGNWAENSSLWTSNLKQTVSFGQEDGGVFFMDLEEFQKNFENVSICQIRDNFESTFRQINLRV